MSLLLAMVVEQACDYLDAFESGATDATKTEAAVNAAAEPRSEEEAGAQVAAGLRVVQSVPCSQLRAQAREFVPVGLILRPLLQPVVEQLAVAVQTATTQSQATSWRLKCGLQWRVCVDFYSWVRDEPS
jgi:hypothetical protein